jgi:RNA polymerase sigma factor (sigma-70 family)
MSPHEPDRTGAVDDRDLTRRLIAGLPAKHRAAISLRYYEDLSDEQIAELLGCRTGTVRSYLSRGLAALREALPAEWVRT